MKRAEGLAPLSRDHHLALVVSQKLRRATDAKADAARQAFCDFWSTCGRRHVRLEDELVLPAYAGHADPHHPLVLKMLGEHLVLWHYADLLASDQQLTRLALTQFGTRLGELVRLEEREVFPLVEEALSDAEMMTLAAALQAAHDRQ